MPKPTPLQPGTLTRFIAEHVNLPVPEIIALGQQHQLKLSPAMIHNTRYNLRIRYGITDPISADFDASKLLVKPKSKSGKTREPSRTKPSDAKLETLRRLIFELGFDTARQVFDEFSNMHERMRF